VNTTPATTPTTTTNPTPSTTPGERSDQARAPHHADMLVIPTNAAPYLAVRSAGLSIPQTISQIIDERTTFGLGVLRVWHHDVFTGRAPNPSADWILPHLGYTHPTGWRGIVVLTMEESLNGQIPAMPAHIVDALVTRTT